jgi:hypothetical protein
MHQNCGNKPQIGQVFKMRGTDAVGLLFTVINHPAGDVQVTGLILASESAPGQGALISDRADRFYQTANPMLTKLFSEWHPGSMSAAFAPKSAAGAQVSPRSAGASPAPAANSGQKSPSTAPAASAPVPPLHTVSAPDNSFQIGLPAGWNLMPGSSGGVVIGAGPQGEQFVINVLKMAVDPYIAYQVTHMQSTAMPGWVVAPFRGNLQREFPTLFQAFRRANGRGPVKLTVDSMAQGQPAGPQTPCVQFMIHIDANDGKEPALVSGVMCASMPSTTSRGDYTVALSGFTIPQSLADREKNTVAAIISSFRPNQAVIGGQVAQAQQVYNNNYSALVNGIRERTVDASSEVMKRQQILHQSQEDTFAIQQAGNANQQEGFARSNQGTDLYIRDRTIIRNPEYPDDHYNVSNSTYNWLYNAFPGRVDEVPPSQYIKGTDYY